MGNDGNADLKYVESAAKTIGKYLDSYTVICTKSTVPIGSGKKIINIINKSKNDATLITYLILNFCEKDQH